MSSEEIKAILSGKTVTGRHDKKGYEFKRYYEPTGTFRSYEGGSKEPRLGKWWVKGSNSICIRWKDDATVHCLTMLTDGKGRYWKVLVKPNGHRIAIVTFHRFEEGNPEDL